MANLPVLRSLPETAVDVIYDGDIGNGKWWIVHIEPSGAVNIWKRPEGVTRYQRLNGSVLALGWASLGTSIGTFMNMLIDSLEIEGLSRAASPGPAGGLNSLSEITYKVTPVSG